MTLSFITVIKLKFQDASTKVQESFFLKLKSQYRYQKLNYLNTLAVIPNQYLINRKGGSRRNVKPRIPPHPTAKQGILFLRRMGYPARKKRWMDWKEVYIWFGSRKVLKYDGARALFFIAYFFCHNIIE